MGDIISTISSAISLVSKLKKIGQNIRDAEFKNVLADLSLQLADAKMKLAAIIEENTQLKEKVRALENAEGEPCPKCHKRGWHIEDSKPDAHFGVLGGTRRTYKCSFCGFSEERLIT
jgi:hypothetical protein